MSRRVSRLRTEPPDRQPVLIVGALIVGLIAGLIVVPRLFPNIDARVENYVLLASALYAQGESPLVLRDRLATVGIAQPASTVLGLAQRYAGSRDRRQQQQAESLEAFGKVLLNPESVVSPTPRPVDAAPVVLPTATALSGAPIASPPPGAGTRLVPIGIPTSNGPPTTGATPVSGITGSPTALAGPAQSGAMAVPTSTPAAIQRGRVKPPDGGSARLRKEPNQNGGTLSLIPNAAQVEILETVHGQAIEGETRWLRVRYGNLVGYLWSKLVVLGD